MISRLILHLQSKAIQRQAMRDLAADVAMRKASFFVQAYIRNRAAQIRGRA